MMKNKRSGIAILGGGVAGMSAAIILAKQGHKVKIFSKDLGGEYLSGGLKYLHATPLMIDFVFDVMGLPIHIEKVNGAILWQYKIYQHPEWLWWLSGGGGLQPRPDVVQQQYWLKTRGDNLSKFESTCMNEPWVYRNELKLIPEGGISGLVEKMMYLVRNNNILDLDKKSSLEKWAFDKRTDGSISIQIGEISEALLEKIIGDYEHIIYTIPISLLGDLYKFKVKFNFRSLNIIRYCVESGAWPLWMDYIYIPEKIYRFHRVSFFKLNSQGLVMDLEVNGTLDESVLGDICDDDVPAFMDFNFPRTKIIHSQNYQMVVKGHIENSESNFEIPDNVFLLGRYAQWNSRITFDKVLDTLAQISKEIQEIG